MKKTIPGLIVWILLLATGCNNGNKQEVPAGIIPHDEMIDIIVDAWLMESSIHVMVTDLDQTAPAAITLYAKFFEEHGISKEQFVQSAEYYMQPEQDSEAFVQECIQRLAEKKEAFIGDTLPILQPQ